jgi:hypothetical protein
MAAGQVQADHVKPLADPAPDLEEPQAQGAELEVRDVTPRQPAPQGIQEPVGGAVQKQAELIGPKG